MQQFLDTLRLDLRFAWRSLRKGRGVALLVIGTLAVGIAVVTATFSFVNTALYRALPYPLAGRSVAIIASPYDWPGNLPPEVVEALRHETRSFARLSAFYDTNERFEIGNTVSSLVGTAVDTGFFATLGARPERGRVLTPDEIAHGAPYAVISYRLWHGSLNGDSNVIGRSLRFDKTLYTVVGVMPPRINYGMAGLTDVWIPQSPSDTGRFYFAFAWLKPGVTLTQARAELGAQSSAFTQSDPHRYTRLNLFVNDEMVVRRMQAQGRALMLFFAVAACVLLIGCANVTTLMLMRHTERRRDLAVRASLGATRARLVRQSLTESLVLAAIAAGVGSALAVVCIRGVAAAFPVGFGTWFRLGIDTHVLLFVIGISAAVVLLVGLAPALQGTRFDLAATLKTGGGSGATPAHTIRRGQRAIGAQVAVAVALLITASLLGVSYWNLAHADRGYNPDGLLTAWLQGHDEVRINADARTLSDALAHDPAIRAVARVDEFIQFRDSTLGGRMADSVYRADPPASAVQIGGRPGIDLHVVSDDYFTTLGIPLVRGRNFVPTDTTGTPLVAVVSERMARALWDGRGDIGRSFRLGRNGAPVTVVGVVGDVRDPSETPAGLTAAPHPDIYFSMRQARPRPGLLQLVVRPSTGEGAATAAITSKIRSVAPSVDGFRIQPYLRSVDESSFIIRLFGGVIGSCAMIAVALSLVGIYGVIGYSVAQRTREIGIRMALGGTLSRIRRQVMSGGMRVAAIGLVVGVVLAAGLAQLMRAWFLGVSPVSPLVYLSTCALFAAAAYWAGYFPTRRATRIDPMIALRSE